MTIQNFYANTEILHSDMNDISGSLLCDLYDNLVRMGFARFSNHGCFGESFNVTRDTGTSVVIQKGLGFCLLPIIQKYFQNISKLSYLMISLIR